MLTTDLVRARIAGGVVVPRYLDCADARAHAAAEALIALFAAHEGAAVGTFQEALADHIGETQDSLPNMHLEGTSGVRARGDLVHFDWCISAGPRATLVRGTDLGTVDGNGRLTSISGFFGDL